MDGSRGQKVTQIPVELLDKHLAGDCAPEESEQVRIWLGEKAENSDFAEELKATLGASENYDARAALDDFWNVKNSEVVISKREQASTKRLSHWWNVVWIVPVITFTLFAIRPWNKTWFSQTAPTTKTYSTLAGQRAIITLPDSSTIVLAPQSRIHYSSNFSSSTNRTILLEGRALFTVTHSSGVPFLIKTGDVTTRVLGTSFAIRHYATDTLIQVIVAQGRVSLGPSVLGTGDIATAKNEANVSVSRGNAVASSLAWAEGRLVFSSVPLREVIPELERWYGITIHVTDASMLNRLVTTAVSTETASSAIELVAFAIEGRGTMSGNIATLYSH